MSINFVSTLSVIDRLLLVTVLTLELMILLGKVHGSLARAGKVKGQTPKVVY